MGYKIKLKDKLMVACVCVILGAILAVQFRGIQADFLGGVMPNQRSVELVAELKKAREERELIEGELADYKGRLAEIEDSASKDNVLIRNLNDEVAKYKLLGGFTDVLGEGVVVTIDNPPSDMSATSVHSVVSSYLEILRMVNELNAAGAEAISINDQRVLSTTEIRNAGNAINVNTVPLQAPLTVKVIGDKNTLEGALNQRFGVVSNLRSAQLQVNVRKVDEMRILKYGDLVSYEYAEFVEQE